jgi:SAM-dependent methyltransferase
MSGGTSKASAPLPCEPVFSSGLYEGTAADYDHYRLPYAEKLINSIRAELSLDGSGLLVDLGAGTGQVARGLRPYFAHVIAVEPELEMVEYGKARTERDSDEIEWRQGRAENADFPSGSVDVLSSGNAFHRFDRPVVVGRAERWLAPGGAIVVLSSDSVWTGDEPWQQKLSEVIDVWLERSGAGARIPAGWERKDHHDEVLLQHAGFRRQAQQHASQRHDWSVDAIIGFLHATSFASRSALGKEIDAFDADVRRTLLACEPAGVFEQQVKFRALIARR